MSLNSRGFDPCRVASALLFVPLCWFIFGPQFSTTRRQSGDLLRSWERVFGMGLVSNGHAVPGFMVFCLVGLLVMALSWRRLETPMRVCMLGGVAIFVSVTLSVSQHALTSSTRLLGVVFWIPLMANLPLFLRRRWPRWTVGIAIGALGMAICIVLLIVERHGRDIVTIKPHDRLAQFLKSWEQWVPDGHDVGFVFPTDQRVARLVITNSLDEMRAAPGCGSDKYCFVVDGHIWMKISPDGIPRDRPTVVVWTRNQHPQDLPDECTSLQSGSMVPDIVRCDPVGR